MMPDGGFGVGGGGSVMGGTVYIGVAVKDLDKFKQAMATVQGESEKTATKAKTQLGSAFDGIKQQLMMMVGAAAIFREAMAGMRDAMGEELGLAQATALMQGFGVATAANVKQLDELSTALENTTGVAKESTLGTFTNLLGVLNGNYQAALDLALMLEKVKLMLPQGGQLASALTGAIGSGTSDRLGRTFGKAGIGGVKDATDAVEKLNERLVALNVVTDTTSVKWAAFREQWRNITGDIAGKFAPVLIVALKGITTAMLTLANAIATLASVSPVGLLARLIPGVNINSPGQLWGKGGMWSGYMQNLWGGGAAVPGGNADLDALLKAVRDALKANADRGKSTDQWADVRQQRGELFDILQRVKAEDEEAARERAVKLAEREGEALRANLEAWQKYQAALKDWNIEQSPAYQGAMQMASLFSDTLVDAITGVKLSFEDLGRSMLRILAQIIARLLELKMTGWINAAFGHSDTSGKPVAPGLVGGESLGGVRPLPGGPGLTLVLQGSSEGVLAAIYRGATLVERRQVAQDTYLVGGRVSALGV